MAGITFDPASGLLLIQGGADNDSAAVQKVNENGVDKVYVTLTTRTAAGVLVSRKTVKLDLAMIKRVQFYGEAGDDVFVNSTPAPSEAHGGAGNDTLYGGSGTDVLHGGAGQDRIKGHDGSDVLDGGPDKDFIYGGRGEDVLKPGDPGENYLSQE